MNALRMFPRSLFTAALVLTSGASLASVKPVPVSHCVADNQGGTAALPTPCRWASTTQEVIRIFGGGIPVSSEIQSTFRIDSFYEVVTSPGGTLGGEIQHFQGSLTLYMQRLGTSFKRTITIPIQVETHSAPRSSGSPVQSFSHEMRMLQGEISGDPDFALLRVVAGGAFGMPSPGHTTLTRLKDGRWVADSDFQITYRVQFQGAQGGSLAGLGGVNPSPAVVHTRTSALDFITVPPNALDSANVPGGTGPVVSASGQQLDLVNGFPAGSSLHMVPTISNCQMISTNPTGPLGGPSYRQSCTISLDTTGDGTYGGFTKTYSFPHVLEMSTAIPDGNDPTGIQNFDTQVTSMTGEISGDPDFSQLRITAGNAFGLPSPGHTTLWKLPSGNWTPLSVFDTTFHVEYVGAPGGPFSGHSGSTTGTIRMTQGGVLPHYPVPGHGLPHAPFGAAQVAVPGDPNQPYDSLDPNSPVELSGFTSSGHDGLQIDVGGEAEGWWGRLDFGLGGALSPLLELMITATGGDPNDPVGFTGDPNNPDYATAFYDPNTVSSIASDPNEIFAAFVIRSTQIGSATVTAAMRHRPGLPPPQITIELLIDGAQVDSQEFTAPFPPSLLTGPIGSSGGRGVGLEFRKTCMDGTCSDGLVGSIQNPVPIPLTLTGSSRGPVLADVARIRYGLPPGEPYFGTRIVAKDTGPMVLQSEAVIQHGARYGALGRTSLHAWQVDTIPPDVSSVTLGDIGPSQQNAIILEADLDGDGEYEPLSSMSLNLDLGGDHHLEPDASVRWDFVGDTPPGSTLPSMTRLSATRAGNGTPQLGLSVFGFTPERLEATALLAGVVQDHVEHTSQPFPPSLAASELLSDSPTGMSVSADFSGVTGACQCAVFTIRNASPTPVTLEGSSAGSMMADELVFQWRFISVPSSSAQFRAVRLETMARQQWALSVLSNDLEPFDVDDDDDGRLEPEDCDDTDPGAWNSPSEARDIHILPDKITLAWLPPYDAGGTFQDTLYDTLRTTVPGGWSGAQCIDSHSPDTQTVDPLKPPLSSAFFYLVRADNACPGTGTLGSGSGGTPRDAPPCP